MNDEDEQNARKRTVIAGSKNEENSISIFINLSSDVNPGSDPFFCVVLEAAGLFTGKNVEFRNLV